MRVRLPPAPLMLKNLALTLNTRTANYALGQGHNDHCSRRTRVQREQVSSCDYGCNALTYKR